MPTINDINNTISTCDRMLVRLSNPTRTLLQYTDTFESTMGLSTHCTSGDVLQQKMVTDSSERHDSFGAQCSDRLHHESRLSRHSTGSSRQDEPAPTEIVQDQTTLTSSIATSVYSRPAVALSTPDNRGRPRRVELPQRYREAVQCWTTCCDGAVLETDFPAVEQQEEQEQTDLSTVTRDMSLALDWIRQEIMLLRCDDERLLSVFLSVRGALSQHKQQQEMAEYNELDVTTSDITLYDSVDSSYDTTDDFPAPLAEPEIDDIDVSRFSVDTEVPAGRGTVGDEQSRPSRDPEQTVKKVPRSQISAARELDDVLQSAILRPRKDNRVFLRPISETSL